MWKSVWLCGLIPFVTMLADPISPGLPWPGMLNSLTGEARINGIAVGPVAAGRTVLEIGDAIKTGEGMAELLLTPGSFLRLGNHSDMILDAVGTSEIRVTFRKGELLLEVLDLQTPIVLEQNGATVIIGKPGLYDFDEKRGVIAIYMGEAQISRNNKQMVARRGFAVRARSLRELPATPEPASMLFSWSTLRSEQLSSESAASAQAHSDGIGKWRGPAWYRNPWSASYTWLSALGVVTGPFGWPYYSPGYVPNSIPLRLRGDSYPNGLPGVEPGPGPMPPAGPADRATVPTVPLTLPGVPQFSTSRFKFTLGAARRQYLLIRQRSEPTVYCNCA
jgi:hypothetical protein